MNQSKIFYFESEEFSNSLNNLGTVFVINTLYTSWFSRIRSARGSFLCRFVRSPEWIDEGRQSGTDLPFLDNKFLLGNQIYQNTYPIITGYCDHQIATKMMLQKGNAGVLIKLLKREEMLLNISLATSKFTKLYLASGDI